MNFSFHTIQNWMTFAQYEWGGGGQEGMGGGALTIHNKGSWRQELASRTQKPAYMKKKESLFAIED